ncbi:exodeoxyribonuclease III [Methylophilaceae bacterium]|jgi:exodeoxyribonuclease III|nr:exodeoxyribonuclease III [Methylophilaceae bacterium]|tara:strand:+ start:567 stop:1343 length:777 start_codon:yes stop_codon:yes gene_type:complete
MKIATWNVNSLNVRLSHVIEWLNNNQPDILCLQETKQDNDKFLHEEFKSLGWYSYHNGQKTYNGVAIISKKPLTDISINIDGYADIQSRLISGTYEDNKLNKIRIISAYIPNGQSLDSEKFIYKQNWLLHFYKLLINLKTKYKKIIISGDFNISPQNIDCHDPKIWKGKNLVSAIERDYFEKILNLGFTDSFRYLNPNSLDYSWWDYRIPLKRNLGMRIDHILTTNSLVENLQKSFIDKSPRELERPSDHAPVITELK